MNTKSAVGLLFLLVTTYSNPTPKKLLADEVDYRLPTSVVPTKYIIAFNFPESAFTKDGNEFTGTTTINFQVETEITEIKFHVSNDYITITKLAVNNVDLVPTRDYTIDPRNDILSIPTAGMSFTIGSTYTIKIEYTGKISTTDNYGIYKSSYTNSNKETVYLLATQFQATYARRAFPCFDEPSFKATFDVSVTYPNKNNLGVLFNTAPLSQTEGVVTFATTPTMSSYLVALTVSDFGSTTAVNVENDKVPHKVWSREELAASREYAQEVGPTILQKLNDYMGRSYGQDLSKVDQVALPDFTSGAMENWGLVTYREKLLLWNKDDSTTNSKQTIATIIAHELAHQWFGNLITCNWWSETFLNEGFATYFEYFIPHQVEPTWELDKQYVWRVVQKALEADSLETSQALQSEANSPLEVTDKFGTISYEKGGSILRMVSHILGEDNFKAGIKEYIQTTSLQRSTTIPSTLWDILNKHVKTGTSNLPDGTTLTTAMKNWVELSGYPLLTVSLDGKNLKISQERFLLTGEDKSRKWYVPITYVESSSVTKFQSTNPTEWLTPEKPEITVTLTNDNSWVLLNSLQTGFYRIKYDTNLLKNIVTALNKENFDEIVELNRGQIVDDLFSLAKANKIPYSEVLEAIAFLSKDTSYSSWVPALTGFSYMIQRIPEGNEITTKLKQQVLTLMDALYKSVGFDEVKDDDQVYSLKQLLAITWACNLGEEQCITNSKTLFSELRTKGTKLNKNLKSVIYCNALKNSDDVADYEYLWAQYTSSEDSAQQIVILNSLGCSTNEEKLKELLAETIKASEESKIRSQDSLTAFAAVYGGTSKGVDVTLQFLEQNLAKILEKYTQTSSLRSLITGIAGKLTTDAQIQKLKSIIQAESFPSEIKDSSEKAVVEAQSNINWIAAHRTDLEKFYDIEVPPTTTPKPGGANTAHINMVLLTIVSIISLLAFFAN